MADIMHLLRIKAPAGRVYEAITTGEVIRSWWTREADLDEAVGGTGEFRFSAYAEESVTTVRIEELVPPTRVVWGSITSFRAEWDGTRIFFDLREEGSDTVLSFSQRGFRNADEIYALTTTGWGYYLVSLQQYLETGQGAPSPEIDFSRMLK